MTLPASWAVVTVTATYTNYRGTPLSGSVSFISRQTVSVDGQIIIPQRIEAVLDATGSISVELPSVDDPDISPNDGWAYQVVENIPGAGSPYWVKVPASSPTMRLSDATRLVEAPVSPIYSLRVDPNVAVGTPAVTITDVSRSVQELHFTLPASGGGGGGQGQKGDKGDPGDPGQIRFTGHGAPTVLIGATAGDTYLDLDTGDIYKLS